MLSYCSKCRKKKTEIQKLQGRKKKKNNAFIKMCNHLSKAPLVGPLLF